MAKVYASIVYDYDAMDVLGIFNKEEKAAKTAFDEVMEGEFYSVACVLEFEVGVYRPVSRKVVFSRRDHKCKLCDGDGIILYAEPEFHRRECALCEGTGLSITPTWEDGRVKIQRES